MKKALLLIVTAMVVAVPVSLYAGWMKTYGWEGFEAGRCLQITSDNGYIVAGDVDEDIWILKMDSAGDTSWTLRYGDDDVEFGWCVQETEDGGYIVTGSAGTSHGDVLLLKLDSEGNIVWEKFFGEELETEIGYCVRQTSDGGYIVTGESLEEGLLLMKTDANGDKVWSRYYGLDRRGFCLEFTSNDGYIITGSGYGGMLLFETNADGDSVWAKTYKGDGLETGRHICKTADNGYIIAGKTASFGLGFSDPWLVKTDSAGDTLWTKVFESEEMVFNEATCVKQTADGGYILTALDESSTANGWLIKTDSAGDTVWTRHFGNEGSEYLNSVVQTDDNGYVITGCTDTEVSYSSDLWLLKTDSLGNVGVEDHPTEGLTSLEVTNPIGSSITLRYSNHPEGLEATVFDASGRKVDVLRSEAQSGTLSWGEGYKSGVYFIRVEAGKSPETMKVILFR